MTVPLQILILEDDPLDAELVLAELRRAGFEPDWRRVDTEKAYLEHLHGGLDVILSDYHMPHFNGLRALALLKERGFDIPFILISGTIGEDLAVEAMRQGAADYLMKDRLARLGPALLHAVEESRRRRERKRAEEMLAESQLHYRSLFDNMVEGYAHCRLLYEGGEATDFIYLSVNHAFEPLTGLKNVIGKKVSEVIPGIHETNPEILETSSRVALTGKPERYETHVKSLGIWFAISVYSPGKEHFVAVFDNVTARKAAEFEIRFSEQRYRSLVEATTAIVWETPASGEFEREQPSWTAFTGQSFEELRGRGWLNAVHPGDQVETARAWSAASVNKSIYEVEHRLRARDQTYRNMSVRAVPILAEDGTIQQWIGVHTDVTEERQREKKLADALTQEKALTEKALTGERAKSEFLAVMSHEVRTPMNAILGFSELLAGAPGLTADCRDYVNTITSSGEALLRILDDILDFSRLEAGGLKLEKSLFSPADILRDVHALLAPHAREKHLEFRVTLHDGIPEHLWNDAGRVRQVLLNIVGNAIKFTAQGSVTLGTRASAEPLEAEGPWMDFYVRDTGPGIPEAEQELIFKAFAQADSSISRRYGGTGLGLSISRNLAELLGGKLSMHSEAGGGSEFLLTIPSGVPAGTTPTVQASAEELLDATFASRHPLRVLLVEDDLVNRKLMLMILAKLGYEPRVAQDGAEAVELRRREHFDCILMDLQMPRMGGLEATREIRTMENGGGRAYIAALTANTEEEDRRQCFEAGMDGYMNKPIKRALLAKTLAQASEMARRNEA